MMVYYLFFMLDNEKIISQLAEKLFDKEAIEKELRVKKKIELPVPQRISSELERLFNENIDRFMRYMLGNEDFSSKVKLKLEVPQDFFPSPKIIIRSKDEPNGESSRNC